MRSSKLSGLSQSKGTLRCKLSGMAWLAGQLLLP